MLDLQQQQQQQQYPPPDGAISKPRETSAGIEFQREKLVDIKRSERVKKVRVVSAKSAPSKQRAVAKDTVVAKEAPVAKDKPQPSLWNYQNPKHKHYKKQSERDPNYARRRHASEQRRQQRAQELQAMALANQNRIPTKSRSRSRSLSPNRMTGGAKSPTDVKAAARRSRLDDHDYNQWARADRQVSPQSEPGEHDQERRLAAQPAVQAVKPRPKSPPVPAVRHRLADGNSHHSNGQHSNNPEPENVHPDTLGDQRGHYSDHLPSYAPVENGEFIPFLRSSAFLDPADSMRPLPVSREATQVGFLHI